MSATEIRVSRLVPDEATDGASGDVSGADEAAKRLAVAWSLAGFVVGIWGLVWPRPYGLCLVMQLAVCAAAVALAFLRRGHWTAVADGQRTWVGGVALWPAMALGVRALWDTGFIDWRAPVLCALAITAAVGAAVGVARIERRVGVASVVLPLIFCFSAVWGGLVFVNVRLDGREAAAVPVTVLGKSASGGRHDLLLSRWGGRPDAAPVHVSRSLHQRLAGGDTVCVTLHKGALGWRWYDVDMCR